MTVRQQAHDFLASRRARIRPEQAGLTVAGERRRVAGLRREEVAALAGISIDYYIRLERGNVAGVSSHVLNAVADALQLDDADRLQLLCLARTAAAVSSPARTQRRRRPRPDLLWVLEGVQHMAAHILDASGDVVAANAIGHLLFPHLHDTRGVPNLACYVFTDPRARSFFADWDEVAAGVAATLLAWSRVSPPNSRRLAEVVRELTYLSDTFRRLWANPAARPTSATSLRLHHPCVGDLTLVRESLSLSRGEGLRLEVLRPEPGSPSARGFGLLVDWAGDLAARGPALVPGGVPPTVDNGARWEAQ